MVHSRGVLVDSQLNQYYVSSFAIDRFVVKTEAETLLPQEPTLFICTLDKGKYEFQSSILIEKGEIHIPIPAKVFKHQRRENFRVAIPVSLSASIVATVDRRPINGPISLLNLSLTGCLIEVRESSPISNHSKIDATIVIPGKHDIEFTAKVRRTSNQPTGLQVGLEFLKHSNLNTSQLNQLILMCSRLNRMARDRT